MRFLRSEPKMGYYLIENDSKVYFVFDVYDSVSALHMYEVNKEEIQMIMNHSGSGLSLDRLLISNHQFSKIIDKNEFLKNDVIVYRKRP